MKTIWLKTYSMQHLGKSDLISNEISTMVIQINNSFQKRYSRDLTYFSATSKRVRLLHSLIEDVP